MFVCVGHLSICILMLEALVPIIHNIRTTDSSIASIHLLQSHLRHDISCNNRTESVHKADVFAAGRMSMCRLLSSFVFEMVTQQPKQLVLWEVPGMQRLVCSTSG